MSQDLGFSDLKTLTNNLNFEKTGRFSIYAKNKTFTGQKQFIQNGNVNKIRKIERTFKTNYLTKIFNTKHSLNFYLH